MERCASGRVHRARSQLLTNLKTKENTIDVFLVDKDEKFGWESFKNRVVTNKQQTDLTMTESDLLYLFQFCDHDRDDMITINDLLAVMFNAQRLLSPLNATLNFVSVRSPQPRIMIRLLALG